MLVLSLQWGSISVLSEVSLTSTVSSKLEILPPTARTIPGEYVIIFAPSVVIDNFIATMPAPHDNESNTQRLSMDKQYVYNHTFPVTPNHTPLRGMALSNVSDSALQWLLQSEPILSITPVSPQPIQRHLIVALRSTQFRSTHS
jgi:hypothetical protein